MNAVNNPPIAKADRATTSEATLVNIPVLANDNDPDKDALTILSLSTPQHGRALLKANKTIDYTPKAGFSGTDRFTYTLSDGKGLTASAVVTIIVNKPPNQPPKITSSNNVDYAENGEGVVLNIQSSDDNDSEESGLDYSITGGENQTLFGLDSKTGELTFNTPPDFEKPASNNNIYVVQVTVSDSQSLTDMQTIEVTVTDVDENTAPNAIDDKYRIDSTTVSGNVMDNDFDLDGDAIEVVPLTVLSDLDDQHHQGALTLNSDGSFIYIRDDFIGNAAFQDSFEYTLKDEHGATDTGILLLKSRSVKAGS